MRTKSLKSEYKSIYKWIKIKIQVFIRLIKVLSAYYLLIIKHKKALIETVSINAIIILSTYSCFYQPPYFRMQIFGQ